MFLLLLLLTSPPVFADVKTGQLAPSLVVLTLNGAELSISKPKTKITIIHFLATWCSACSKEMPILNAFYLHHSDEVEIIGLSTDRARDRKKVIQLSNEVRFPIAMLSEAKSNGFGPPETLPLTYFIDQQGNVRKIFKPGTDELTDKSLSSALSAILAH